MDAALAAARLRLRPILMTAFAFILGVVPLILSSGAGAHARILLGLAVFGGMTAASVIGIFLVPVSYYVVERRCIAGNEREAKTPLRTPKKPHEASHEPRGSARRQPLQLRASVTGWQRAKRCA